MEYLISTRPEYWGAENDEQGEMIAIVVINRARVEFPGVEFVLTDGPVGEPGDGLASVAQAIDARWPDWVNNA